MQSEYVYPLTADRTSPKEWVELGRPDLIARATRRKHEILARSRAPLIDAATDARVRAAFKIHV
jgi:trimethylamine---corrinoid protein Co-methyltransferase